MTTGQSASQQPTSTQRPTGSRTSNAIANADVQAIKSNGHAIKDSATAREYLVKQSLIKRDDQDKPGQTAEYLAHALFKLTQASPSTPAYVRDSMRAVAFLIESLNFQPNASNSVATLDSTAAALAHNTTKLESIANDLQRVATGLSERLDAAHSKLEKAVETIASRPTPADGTNTSAPSASYAAVAALAARLPEDHFTTIARMDTRSRQVLIQLDKTDESSGDCYRALQSLTLRELVEKANTTLELMGLEGSDAPQGTSFLAAKLIDNGVVLTLNSPEAAAWLRTTDVAKSFNDKFCTAKAIIKTHVFTIIAEGVPTSFDPDNDSNAFKYIELDSGIPRGSIIGTKWIRPPNRRRLGQNLALLFLHFRDVLSANLALRKGLIISGKLVRTRKESKEPLRCLRCQDTGGKHLASSCPSHVETCGKCAAEHNTNDCRLEDPWEYRCINCINAGYQDTDHAAFDRMCPVFRMDCERYNKLYPVNRYRYFPSNDPQTWELLPPPSQPLQPVPQPVQAQRLPTRNIRPSNAPHPPPRRNQPRAARPTSRQSNRGAYNEYIRTPSPLPPPSRTPRVLVENTPSQ